MRSLTELDREDRIVGAFAALAIAIHVLEAAFPSPVPGIKPGLANVVTLIVLARYSLRLAVWVSLLRVLAGSLLVGSFLSPAFWLSLSGALSSLLVLALADACNRRPQHIRISAVGLSVLSACAHMAGQFGVAWGVFIPHPGLGRLLPVLMTAALVFGLVTGLIAQRVLDRLPQRDRAGSSPG
jgi:heptaprenyl diphosphate synthase